MPLGIDNDVQIYKYADDNTLVCTGYSYVSVKEKLLHNVNDTISLF